MRGLFRWRPPLGLLVPPTDDSLGQSFRRLFIPQLLQGLRLGRKDQLLGRAPGSCSDVGIVLGEQFQEFIFGDRRSLLADLTEKILAELRVHSRHPAQDGGHASPRRAPAPRAARSNSRLLRRSPSDPPLCRKQPVLDPPLPVSWHCPPDGCPCRLNRRRHGNLLLLWVGPLGRHEGHVRGMGGPRSQVFRLNFTHK